MSTHIRLKSENAVRRAAPLLLILLFARLPALADAVDDLVREAMDRQRIAGLSLAVVKEGRVVRTAGYGYANLEWKNPARPDTLYQIGSVTKPLTAQAVLMLADEGRISLDDRLSRHVPEVPEDWGKATIRHLLQHTSGIPSETEPPGFQSLLTADYTPVRLLSMVRHRPLEFEPGARWSYSNMGYYLLGLVIERASGLSYAAFMRERIFQPLGMASTRVNSLEEVIPNRASGYGYTGEYRNIPALDPRIPYAAGAVLSSVEDLAKWEQAMDARRHFPASCWEPSWVPARTLSRGEEQYGLGWAMDEELGRKRVFHSGGIPVFSSVVLRYPEQRITVIVLCNQLTGLGGLATRIASHWLPAPAGARRIAFSFPAAEGQKEVSLAGSFNGWSFHPMTRVGQRWVAEQMLPPGRYPYKFVVDGTWVLDPENASAVGDGHGNTNSVIEVAAAPR